VALIEWWAEKYSDKGVGFYSMHPGWADTPGVAKSLPGLSEKWGLLSLFMLALL
jgi:dehydrogenase/reductase SDR family protein 12